MSRRFRQYFGQMDLTFPQAMVLTALQEDGEMPISHLAEYTGSANSTVSGIVDRLEKLELVKRVRSDEDRRVIYVALTDKYRAALQSEQPNVNDCFSGVLEKLTEEERAGIAAVLDKLCRVLNEDEN
jgi:DNA-binding MarR family transcriptional regulator